MYAYISEVLGSHLNWFLKTTLKKAIRTVTFSYYRKHTNPIFSKLNTLKPGYLALPFTMQSLCTITIMVIYLVFSVHLLLRLVKNTVTRQD